MASREHADNLSTSGVHHSTRHDMHKPNKTSARAVNNYMDHDLDLKVDNLAQAKDRAQLTATGAMSVVHVALLKEVLDKGKNNMRYFTITMTLICISLALQILAGALALIVSHLRSYYAKYKDDLIEDMFENLCCCKVISTKGASSRKIARAQLMHYGEDMIDASTAVVEVGVSPDGVTKRQEEADEPASTRLICCGCSCGGNRTLSNYEYDILAMYDEWGAEHTEMELLAAEADVQVPYLSDLLQEAKLNLQDLEATKDEISDVEFNKRYQELRQKLDELQHKKDIFEDAQRKLAVSTAKGEILMLRSDSVRRNRVLKLASFWQQMINYVFYVVFILNAFITGIGIASE